jgi:hypothetical protein
MNNTFELFLELWINFTQHRFQYIRPIVEQICGQITSVGPHVEKSRHVSIAVHLLPLDER